MRIAIIDFNDAPDIQWRLGSRLTAAKTLKGLNQQIISLLTDCEYIYFANSRHGLIADDLLKSTINSRGDFWHGGRYNVDSGFYLFNYSKPCLMFNLCPENDIEFVSWKVNSQSAIIPTSVFNRYGLFREDYTSVEAAFFDWGYNVINHGGIPIYRPELSDGLDSPVFNLSDQVIFLRYHFPALWIRWALWRAACHHKITLRNLLRFWNIKSLRNNGRIVDKDHKGIDIQHSLNTPRISVVIITLKRYLFLKHVIEQLMVQTIPVTEIIIVDATPEPERQTDLVNEPSRNEIIKILYSDVIGQCTQRNMGINHAIGELIYFCDDDMEQIPPDHLQKHLDNLIRHKADVSCGMPDEVGILPINREKMISSVSNVFPTNDLLAYKEILYKAGLFDIKMDRGQSEDHDLGIRVFLAGGIMMLDPLLKSLHLRAGSGGLREHGVRLVTSARSRESFFKFRLFHTTEIYLNVKYFSKKWVKESLIINLFATGSIRGSLLKRILKVFISVLYLYPNYRKLKASYHKALRLLN